MKRNRLLIIGQLASLLFLGSCNSDDEAMMMPVEEGTDQTYQEVLSFTKDKAKYNPGEEVTFSVNGTHQNTMVRYKYLGEVVAEENLASRTWTWTPPSEDFRGYMVELVKTTGGEETVLGTLGVDVSSDWTKFPRYGFLSEFGNVSPAERSYVLNNLKDYHINGLQYYDWHSKHHIPLPTDENGNPAESWTDLFNREVYFETVEDYVESAKGKNMASMFYNLLFGAWHPEEDDGFEEEWLIFNDRIHNSINKHSLGDLGDILITDPSNEEWQSYIFEETEVVYSNLDFAGWHLDQLGNRGTVYDYNGYEVQLPDTYQDFLTELNQEFPDKKMVLNAVDQYGQKEILNSPVDFAYTEVWSRYQYQDLVEVIKENYEFSDGELNTVLAAYMNYDSQEGNFNTPSVLMADAVIFAFGGSHLELGEHMLSSEYFPNTKLSMTSELREKLKEYYDFQVAYQNLLRDGGTFNMPSISTSSEDVTLNQWPPVFSQTATVGKQFNDKQVVHLLNFDGASTLQWRDNSKIQTAPNVREFFEVQIEASQTPSKVWFASPDVHGGASQELEFTQTGNTISVEVPYLEYWSMIVLEY
ncbi:MAG: glycoside hydrolase family 66 protein [Christiangramia sp.]|nr:glycoside hydrolase family 66 protein [Christiangramia sp.]